MPNNVFFITRDTNAAPTSGPRRRVCMVEDDPVARVLVREVVEGLKGGIAFDPHESAEEALYSGVNLSGVELFVIDYHLPGMTGAEFIRRVRHDSAVRKVPILMLSAERDHAILTDVFDAGVSDFVNKPVELYELSLRVRNLIAIGRHPKLIPSNEPLRVVLVEDDPVAVVSIRAAIGSAIMTKLGQAVALRVFGSAEAAAAALIKPGRNSNCDLLIADYALPGDSGIELVRKLRTKPPFSALPILLITSDLTVDVKWSALEAGVTEYLRKPFEPIEFSLRVRNLLALSRGIAI